MTPLRLQVLGGPLKGRILDPGNRCVLGGRGADLDLGDPFVSGRHAELRRDGRGFSLRDLGSRNGTWIDGLPVEGEARLEAGAVLRLGATSLRLVADRRPEGSPPRTSGGRGATLDLAALREAGPGPREPWFEAVAKVLLSPARGDELHGAVLEACVGEGPFARLAYGPGDDPDEAGATGFAARAAAGEGLIREPVALALERGEPALVVDLALDPSRSTGGHLFCSAAFAPLHLPGRGCRAWIYGDTLGEARSLTEADLVLLGALGRALLGLQAREGASPGQEREQGRFLGQSPAVRALVGEARKLAGSDLPVLLVGETGTGKEVLARLLHDEGPRRDGAFVPVNCAALPESLAESILFGHRRGSFTGADRDARGLVRESSGGTLFLDEVAELPPPLQAKLLRVLQEREVRGLGEDATEPVDLRVVAATHRDLRAEVAAGRFREDLLFRLAGVELRLPPLRERREDLPLLARFFVDLWAERDGLPPRPLAAAAEARLREHGWPGNVRELGQVLRAALLLGRGPEIEAGDLRLGGGDAGRGGGRGGPGPGGDDGAFATLEDCERRQILLALERSAGNKSAAARLLGVDRSTLYDKIRRHGL
ncbi:MAG: sigma 54-interacting transcriptional regulator [Planctomycetota bacterium]